MNESWMRQIVLLYVGVTTILLGGLAAARLLLSGGTELARMVEGVRARERGPLAVLATLLVYLAVGLCLLPIAAGIVFLGLAFIDITLGLGGGIARAWSLDRLFYGYLSAPLALGCFNTSLLLSLLGKARGWQDHPPQWAELMGIAFGVLAFFFLWSTVGLWIVEGAPELGAGVAWLPWLGGAAMTVLSLAARWFQDAERKKGKILFSLAVLAVALLASMAMGNA